MSETAEEPLALIVGASRGLGLGLAREYLSRGWRVVATVRGSGTALHELTGTSAGHLEIEQLDITEPEQIQALRERLAGRRIDLLFVNAGVADDASQTIGDIATDEFMRLMLTNTLGPMRVVEAMQDLVPARGMIVAMSSGLGSVAGNESGGWETYRGSKAALNTLMRSFAARSANGRRCVIMAPGWVRTDMGGAQATLDVETSVKGMVDTLEAQPAHDGARYLDYRGETVPW